MARFPIVTEGRHPAEFVLSEAWGQRSRDNGQLVDPSTVTVGQLLQQTVPATTDQFATYVVATTGANAHAVSLYGGSSMSGENLKISLITRDAELNYKLINFGAMSNAEKAAAMTALATRGIILRD